MQFIHSALNLNAGRSQHTLVTGLGRDETIAAMVMSAAQAERPLAKPAAILNSAGKARPQLLKRVSLGGESIATLLHQKLNSSEFRATKQHLLTKVMQASANTVCPLDFSNISTPYVSAASIVHAQDQTHSILQSSLGETVVQKTPKPQLTVVVPSTNTNTQSVTNANVGGTSVLRIYHCPIK